MYNVGRRLRLPFCGQVGRWLYFYVESKIEPRSEPLQLQTGKRAKQKGVGGGLSSLLKYLYIESSEEPNSSDRNVSILPTNAGPRSRPTQAESIQCSNSIAACHHLQSSPLSWQIVRTQSRTPICWSISVSSKIASFSEAHALWANACRICTRERFE